ncbi:MAG: hypothetical protein ACHQVK_04635 [Candidatus Paceibacterales bacterium]
MQGSSVLLALLKEIDPTMPYGTDLYNALAKLTPSVGLEAVCIRCSPQTEAIEVYLVQRSLDDTAYPGQWHAPGSVLRSSDPDEESVFDRLVAKEFGGAQLFSKQFVTRIYHPTSSRGCFMCLVYLCVLEESTRLSGKWFSIDRLPKNTIRVHRHRIIPAALGAFVAQYSNICR